MTYSEDGITIPAPELTGFVLSKEADKIREELLDYSKSIKGMASGIQTEIDDSGLWDITLNNYGRIHMIEHIFEKFKEKKIQLDIIEYLENQLWEKANRKVKRIRRIQGHITVFSGKDLLKKAKASNNKELVGDSTGAVREKK